jgi:4-hydroxyphenylacetate 3-monooxygenase
MTFAPIGAYPGGRRRINRCWQRPRNLEELVQRRQALVAWAEQSGGFVGRSPDHVASSLLGQVIGIEVFRRHGGARAKALLDYFDHASRSDLFLSYVIINPQADLSKAWGQQDDELVAQLVDEDAAASRCAAQKCSAPAPSWPTRSWSPIFSR